LGRFGSRYVAVCVLLVQLLLLPGLIVLLVVLRVNAQFTAAQLGPVALLLLCLSIAASIILAGAASSLTRAASRRIGKWSRNETLTGGSQEELLAWRQITSAGWRYGLLALVFLPLALLVPLLGYLYQSLQANNDQITYALLGGIIAVISTVLLATLLLERALAPARTILLPRSFEAQLAGAAGLHIERKFILSIMGVVIISVLLIAPIGYHMSYVILYEPLTSELVFQELRRQSLIASAIAIGFGIVLAFLISRSLSGPIGGLIDVFRLVEQGQLQSRAKVGATDEVGELAVFFNRMISRLEELQTGLADQVDARTAQLEATIEVGRVANSILNPDALIDQVTRLISARFGYYYAAIFLLDEEGAWADLRAATGEAGKLLLDRRHRLPIGGKSMVSAAVQERSGKIALDVGDEPVRFDNPLLPNTRSEIALPLIAGNQVLGALDVQSIEAAAFDESDINTLQNMANQVAIAIENARLFRATAAALAEVRAASAEAFQRGWAELARGGPLLSFETGRPGRNGETATQLEVPLALRGQRMGSIFVEGVDEWTPSQSALLEAIAGQAALALENARLLSESQQTALRERLAAAITERIWSSTSIEAVLQTTARELGRALEASEATIELTSEGRDE
jgi:GAF domain-containing protein/HAMP domain-containing protein